MNESARIPKWIHLLSLTIGIVVYPEFIHAGQNFPEAIAKASPEKQGEWLKQRDKYMYTICNDLIHNKSYSGIKTFLKGSDAADFPELKAIIIDFVRIRGEIVKKFQKYKGKTVTLTVKGKKKKYKILDCDKEYVIVGVKVGSKIIKAKLKHRYIRIDGVVNKLENKSAESKAFYCAVNNMAAGNKSAAEGYVARVGILQNGLCRSLGLKMTTESSDIRIASATSNTSYTMADIGPLDELPEY